LILFWVICALLLVIALAFVLPTALQRSEESVRKTEDARRQANIAVYRDQLSELEADLRNGIVSEEQYAQDREEIKRRLLEDTATVTSKEKATTTPAGARSTAYALGLGLPALAIVLYSIVGNPKAITNEAAPTFPTNATQPAAPPERTQEQIEANVAKLAERLKSNPSDAQGWTMLARSYSSMEKFGEAAGAYAKATELTPKDADLWAEYAFASAMAAGRSLQGKPMELINRALKVDPENAKALQLAGSAAFEAKDYQKAVDYWQRVLKQVPPDSEVGRTIASRINEAKELAAGK
jgi:cytochrome c-type biogenesis protein CcmH